MHTFVLIPPLNETPIRIIPGLPLVLFLPGYSLIAALFPRKDDLDGIERVALSFGLSIAISPLLGLALNYTPFGIRLSPILALLSLFTVSFAIGALVRRSMIPEGERFDVDFGVALINLKESFKAADTKIDRILSITLVISIVLAIVMVIYVRVTPKQGEKFTEFYVLGPGLRKRRLSYSLTEQRKGLKLHIIYSKRGEMNQLKIKIICVVGLGYVGLPLSRLFQRFKGNRIRCRQSEDDTSK